MIGLYLFHCSILYVANPHARDLTAQADIMQEQQMKRFYTSKAAFGGP